MANEKLCFKGYINCIDDKTLSKTRKRVNKKSHKGRWYGGVSGDQSGADGGAMGESHVPLLNELMGAALPSAFTSNVLNIVRANQSEEQETTGTAVAPKIERARALFKSIMNQPDITRADIIEAMVQNVGVKHSTAVSYYERLAKEFGIKKQDKEGMGGDEQPGKDDLATGDPAEDEIPDLGDDEDLPGEQPSETGIIRTVDDAHLVYKRQNEEGTFDELWVFNTGENVDEELTIRRAILAGTDIPPKKTRSADGSQKYSLTTLGNGQLLFITGMPS